LRLDYGHLTPNNGKIFCKDGNEWLMRDVRACIDYQCGVMMPLEQ